MIKSNLSAKMRLFEEPYHQFYEIIRRTDDFNGGIWRGLKDTRGWILDTRSWILDTRSVYRPRKKLNYLFDLTF